MKHIKTPKFHALFIAICAIALFTAQCTNTQKESPTDEISTPANDWFCSTIDLPPAQSMAGQRAVGDRSKFWPTGSILKIGFVGGTSAQIAAVKTYVSEWSNSANITFTFPSSSPYDIRISFDPNGGAWSYIGTDVKKVTSATMNLGWIGRDVILHEFGHTLGLYHEHQNPNGGICWNEKNVIADLQQPPNNWSLAMIRFNVLDPIKSTKLESTPWDRVSIMHYNIPARWTCNNVSISGGSKISATDAEFMRKVYPGKTDTTTTNVTLTEIQIDNILAILNSRKIESDTNAARLNRSVAEIKKALNR